MAEMGVYLTKAVIGGAISKVMSSIAEEAELKERVHNDIEFMKAELEMMQSFLGIADEERINNSVVRTWVRQVRDLAYDVEDYFEVFVYLDLKKSTWWWRIVPLPSCIPRPLTLDEAVDGIKRLRARVEDVSQRNLRYRLIGDSGSGPVSADQATAATVSILRGVEEAKRKQRDLHDLTKLITRQRSNLPQLQVISVWKAAGDLSLKTTSIIRKAFTDRKICEAFPSRAWVKPMHPFNPVEFLRSLLTQFAANSIPGQFGAGASLGGHLQMKKAAADMEDNLVEGDVADIKEFMQQVNRKRYLIVIEDLATLVEWDAIKMYLPDGENMSRIIVSTPHLGIAGQCTGEPYQVSGLMESADDDSVCVFFNEISRRPLSFDDMLTDANEFMGAVKLIGRHRELDQLYLNILYRGDSDVISLWGIAGVGKSVLIKTIYCKEIQEGFNSKFSHFTWIDVPHPFSLAEFSRCLHRYSHSQANNDSHSLIVIDGLRSTEEWDLIKNSLRNYTPYTIIAITDDESVARHCANVVLNIKCLEAGAALDLFAKETRDQGTRQYGDKVHMNLMVNKCGGLPKVIVDVARYAGWDNWSFLREGGFMRELETNPAYAGLMAWTKFFFRTCPDHLKPFVYYMSVFPVSCNIRQNRLVRRWIAEGYYKDTDDNRVLEEGKKLEKIFSSLLDLSIIQRSSKDTLEYTVNGFFREYMVSQPMQDNLVCVLDNRPSSTSQHRERYLSVQQDYFLGRDVRTIDFSLLRSLSVFTEWRRFIFRDKMMMLQVLDLEDATDVSDDELPVIECLPRLKFLSLRGCKEVTCWPRSWCGLEHLETLDVKGTSITKFPRAIIKLQKLQHFRAGRTIPLALDEGNAMGMGMGCPYNAGVLVPQGIGKLRHLGTLGVVNVGAAGGKDLLKNLGDNFRCLRKLGVSGINRGNMKFLSLLRSCFQLRSLLLRLEGDNGDYSDMLNDIDISPDLESLKIYGPICKFPAEIIKKFYHSLRKLTLQFSMLASEDMEVISDLRHLSVLRIFFDQFQGDKLSFRSFRSYLKVLEVACKTSLHVTFEGWSMVGLEVLKVHCNSGTQISGLKNLKAISEVCLNGSCDEALEQEVRRQIANHPLAPVLRVEGERSSTGPSSS